VTLNDPEPHNGHYCALFHRIRWLLEPITTKWLTTHLYCLQQKRRTKNLVLAIYYLLWYSQRLLSMSALSTGMCAT